MVETMAEAFEVTFKKLEEKREKEKVDPYDNIPISSVNFSHMHVSYEKNIIGREEERLYIVH